MSDFPSPSSEPTPDVSVLIVGYRSLDLLGPCLDGLRAHTRGVNYEVLFLDNSDDGSMEMLSASYPWVRRIDAGGNLGFARGNNRLSRDARGRYLLLLNPDTVIEDNAIGRLVAFADAHPEAGAVSGMCRLPSGDKDPGSFQRPPSLVRAALNLIWVSQGWLNERRALGDGVFDVPVLNGAFTLIHRDVWEALGGFDESFFMYAEEVDLCMRVRKAGRPLLVDESIQIVHLGGGGQRKTPARILHMVRGRFHLLRKHEPKAKLWMFGVTTWCYHAQRYLAGWLLRPVIGTDRAKRLTGSYHDIVWRPWLWWHGWGGHGATKGGAA